MINKKITFRVGSTTLLILGVLCGILTIFAQPPQHSAAASCFTSDQLKGSPCRTLLTVAPGKYPQAANDPKSQLLFHEQRIGRQVDGVKVYHTAGDVLNANDVYIATRANTFLMLNWKPTSGSWGSVNAGNTATTQQIDNMAKSIKAVSPNVVFITLWHEAENDVSSGTTCTTLKGNRGSPADFVNMYHYVHDRFAADGTTNVVWAIDYMNYSPWDCLVNLIYPGDAYVDWIVFNGYGKPATSDFSANVSRFYNLLSSNSGGGHNYQSKKWGIAEWSDTNMNEAQGVSYFTQAKQALESNEFPKLQLYTIFDNVGPDGNENRVGYVNGVSNKATMDAYTAFAQSPALGGNGTASSTGWQSGSSSSSGNFTGSKCFDALAGVGFSCPTSTAYPVEGQSPGTFRSGVCYTLVNTVTGYIVDDCNDKKFYNIVAVAAPTNSDQAKNGNCPDQSLGSCDIVSQYVNPVITALTIIVVLAAVISIVIGGIQYSASADQPAEQASARKRIIGAVIALLCFSFLWTFLQWVIPGGLL